MRLRAVLAALALLSCTQSTPAPSPTPTAVPELAVIVGGDERSSLARRALLLWRDAANRMRAVPENHGVAAVRELVTTRRADARTLAVVGADIIAAEILRDASPRVAEAVPIARLASEPLVVAVDRLSPIGDGPDLRRRLEAEAGAYRFAGLHVGSVEHQLAALLVRDAAKSAAALVYAAYPSGAEAIRAVRGAQSQVLVLRYEQARDGIDRGEVRVLAVSTASRVPGLDAPALGEIGFAVSLANWALALAPPGITTRERDALQAEVRRAYANARWPDLVRVERWLDDLSTEGLTTFLGVESTRTISVLVGLGLARPP